MSRALGVPTRPGVACLAVLVAVFVAAGPREASGLLHAAPPPSSIAALVALRRTEPSMAINPRDPLDVVVATNSSYLLNKARRYPAGLFVSADGGQTWQGADIAMPAPFGTGADTSVAFDRQGVAYVGLMGEDYRLFCHSTKGAVALLVARSTDGGHTLHPPVVVDTSPAGEDDDKPYIAVADLSATAGHPAHTAVYLAWTRWGSKGGSRIMVARSDDGGATFSPPQQLYASRESNMGAQPAVGPDGTLYVAWSRYTSGFLRTPVTLRVMVARSVDGGRTFAPPVALAASWSLPQTLPPGLLRVYTLPSLAVDPWTGMVYVVWARSRVSTPVSFATVDADIVLSRSSDRGMTWSAPAVLNDVSGGDRFMPSVAVLPGGVVSVVFYDRRADHRGFGVYLATIRDRGNALLLFPNVRLTPRASPVEDVPYYKRVGTCVDPGRFLGDYITLAADASSHTVAAVWADSQSQRQNETDVRYARVPLARLLAGTPRSLPFSGATPSGSTPTPAAAPATPCAGSRCGVTPTPPANGS